MLGVVPACACCTACLISLALFCIKMKKSTGNIHNRKGASSAEKQPSRLASPTAGQKVWYPGRTYLCANPRNNSIRNLVAPSVLLPASTTLCPAHPPIANVLSFSELVLWCAAQKNPRGPKKGTEKTKKGGSFLCHHTYCYRCDDKMHRGAPVFDSRA